MGKENSFCQNQRKELYVTSKKIQTAHFIWCFDCMQTLRWWESWITREKYSNMLCIKFLCTVKPVYNDHPQDPKIVAVVDWWSLLRGHLCCVHSKWGLKSGYCREVVVIRRWSLTQVWIYSLQQWSNMDHHLLWNNVFTYDVNNDRTSKVAAMPTHYLII